VCPCPPLSRRLRFSLASSATLVLTADRRTPSVIRPVLSLPGYHWDLWAGSWLLRFVCATAQRVRGVIVYRPTCVALCGSIPLFVFSSGKGGDLPPDAFASCAL
jgi:hypothetical protein